MTLRCGSTAAFVSNMALTSVFANVPRRVCTDGGRHTNTDVGETRSGAHACGDICKVPWPQLYRIRFKITHSVRSAVQCPTFTVTIVAHCRSLTEMDTMCLLPAALTACGAGLYTYAASGFVVCTARIRLNLVAFTVTMMGC